MKLIGLLPFLLLIVSVNALTLNESTRIRPNNSASGYYVLNNTIIIDELKTNSTHSTFTNLSSSYRTATIVNGSGVDIETVCLEQQNCSIPQTSSVKNLLFGTSTTTTPPSISGGRVTTILTTTVPPIAKGATQLERFTEEIVKNPIKYILIIVVIIVIGVVSLLWFIPKDDDD